MASRLDTEITHSPDGPVITFRGKDSEASFDLRQLVWGPIYAAANTLEKRTLREWLKAQQEERKEDPMIRPRDEPRGPLSAFRRAPRRGGKR
jgi:hypothetical protein